MKQARTRVPEGRRGEHKWVVCTYDVVSIRVG